MRTGDRSVVVQSLVYAGSTAFMGLVAAGCTAVITRSMSTSAYGSFSFAVAGVTFLAMFFEFGLFVPASIRAARATGDGQREIVGAAVAVYLPIAVAFSAAIFASSFFVDSAFHVHAADALRAAALLSWAFPFLLVVQQLAQGANRLHIYSIGLLGAQILVLVFTGAWVLAVPEHSLSVTTALVLRSAAFCLACLAMAWWLRPRVARVRAHAGELVRDARSFGLSMYLGRILSIGTYSMDVLMLGIFADARVVGFYTLAGSIAALLSSTLGGVASALFPKMVKDESVSRRWVMLVSVAGGAGLLVLVLASRLLIGVAFSARYDAAAALILPLGIAAVIRAVTMLYNLLLQARGQGRELRNAGLALTVSNVVLNFALIPPLKAWGAAWASVGALVVNLLVHILYAHRPHGLVKPATMVSTLTPDRQVHHRGLT